MRTGNLQSAAGRIQEAWDDLQTAWHQAREHWADQQAATFEETYMKHIAEELAGAFPAIGQLAQTFGTAGRECNE